MKGSCHCQAVTYEAEVDLNETMTCNCSICGRSGSILAFVPAAKFTLLSGEDNLSEYLFNKKQVHHVFCKTCGIKSFSWGLDADGNKTYAVNASCLEEVDVHELNPKKFNGKDL